MMLSWGTSGLSPVEKVCENHVKALQDDSHHYFVGCAAIYKMRDLEGGFRIEGPSQSAFWGYRR